MTWKFYCDISGHEGDPKKLLVAGGYLATERQWLAWEREWTRVLAEFGVMAFHATECNSGRGEFNGWDDTKKKRFSKLVTAITEARLEHGFGWGVRCDADYEQQLGSVLQGIATLNGRMTPRMYITVTLLGQVARHLGLKQRFDVVIERERGSNETAAFLGFLKREKEGLATCFGTVETQTKAECVRLQAADLIAHECWRANCEVLDPRGRAERKSLARLGRRNRLQVALIKPSGLANLAKHYRDFLALHPTGIQRPK